MILPLTKVPCWCDFTTNGRFISWYPAETLSNEIQGHLRKEVITSPGCFLFFDPSVTFDKKNIPLMEMYGNNWKYLIYILMDLWKWSSLVFPTSQLSLPIGLHLSNSPQPSIRKYPPKPTVYSWPQKMRVVAGNCESLAKLAFIEAFHRSHTSTIEEFHYDLLEILWKMPGFLF